jgi:CubicO group peptidase (beta-lactamase class C family)
MKYPKATLHLTYQVMSRKSVLVGFAVGVPALAAIALFCCASAIRVATGFASHTLCSEIFVAGLDPDRTFSEVIGPMPGLQYLTPLMHYSIDRGLRAVRVSLGGLFPSKAVYRDGYGCRLDYGDSEEVADRAVFTPSEVPADLPEIAGPALVATSNPLLQAALDRAFTDRESEPRRAISAIVVVHDNRIIAERYASDFSIDTPLLSWSVAKSVINALIGILVREGRLSPTGPAPVPAWHDPADPRHAISVAELMRMTSGLALDEADTGFDPSSQMLYTKPDMAGYAEAAPLIAQPGQRWHYSSPSTLILSRIIRDAVGGSAGDVLDFARRELFTPLGMRGVTMEFDETGTPVGSSYMFATARDWARFGLLYANDGMVGERRLLPEGWVDFSAMPVPGSDRGYGAGFLTDRGDTDPGMKRVRDGMPADSFLAAGILGRWIVIAPREHLVIVCFGVSQDWPSFGIRELARFVRDVIVAINLKQ